MSLWSLSCDSWGLRVWCALFFWRTEYWTQTNLWNSSNSTDAQEHLLIDWFTCLILSWLCSWWTLLLCWRQFEVFLVYFSFRVMNVQTFDVFCKGCTEMRSVQFDPHLIFWFENWFVYFFMKCCGLFSWATEESMGWNVWSVF